MAKLSKKVERVWNIFKNVNSTTRRQWEFINQKGFDFANDNQLTEEDRQDLEDQGMPTFTINRIMPVVEMLNFYATANRPRWNAIGVDGSDVDLAALFSDISDYIWDISNGSSLYGNAVNDCITKSVGYLMVSVDADSDNGMGDVRITQPEPFDVFVDPKARDILFRDASFIIIRKVLPKTHLINLYPEKANVIKKASGGLEGGGDNFTEKSLGPDQKDFSYKDIDESETSTLDGDNDDLIEYYELYEKIKVPYINVFLEQKPSKKEMKLIAKQVQENMQAAEEEFQVKLLEKQKELEGLIQEGKMIPERAQLELKNFQEEGVRQLKEMEEQAIRQMEKQKSTIIQKVVSEAEMKILKKEPEFVDLIVEEVKFFQNRIKYTCVAGDNLLRETVLPENITEYPIIPFHFKWTGTPFPISAVSPLIGKQMELNKAHQLMVHNASLGSSLRWMHEEGSVDTDYWEKYASSPGALLPIRPGAAPPTPVQPAPLSNAFFGIVQEGKQDMEYLAGIFGSMMGDTQTQHDTFRGMLAMDEYGTRRVKQWLRSSIEPALKQMGEVVKQFSQAVYTAHKVFRIVQPNAIQEDKQVEMNVPLYNDFGQVIGKWRDYASGKFDVRIVSGSTMPVNRWAYLDEMKQLLQLGVIDDIAVLAESDIKNKETIVKRKSMYSQMQGQLGQMDEKIKDQAGTIETLERQLVQAGIKNKVMQADVEINKKKEEVKGEIKDQGRTTAAEQKVLREKEKMDSEQRGTRAQNETDKAVDQTKLSLQSIIENTKIEMNRKKALESNKE